MFLFIFLVCVILLVLMTGMIFPGINILKSAVISVSLFFCLYVTVSSMFFLADNFRMLVVMGVCALLLSGGTAFLYFIKKKKPEYDFDMKSMLLPLAVCIAAFPFVALKNQYFGMGQDQGVYQTAALNYYYGFSDRIQTIDECSILDGEDAANYKMLVNHKLGGYDTDFNEYVNVDKDPDTIPAFFHGIPVFAAMLAMWAKIAGLENMLGVQTIFYLCSVMLVMLACQNMNLKKTAQLTAGLTTAFCSVVIWVAQAALTETFQLLLFSLFIYFITDNDNKKRRWFSVIPVAAFAFFHVCIYTLIPLFVLIFTALYIFEKERQFIYCAAASTIAYLAGFFTMRTQQPVYTLRNYADLYGILKFLNPGNIHIAVSAGCLAVLAVLAAVVFIAEKKVKYTPESVLKYVNEKKVFRLLVIAILVLPVCWMAAKMLMKSYSFDQIRNTSIAGFIFTTGAFIFPFAYGTVIAKPDTVTKNTARLTVFAMFAYCVLVYSAFLRPDIKHYYYYSRYIAPFIPALAMFAALAADRFRWFVPAPVTALSLVCLMPFDTFLMHNPDDTRTEWSILEDYDQVIPNGSCVIIDNDMLQTSFFTVRNMNLSAVFPVFRDLAEEVDVLDNHYDSIYYLTDDEETGYDGEYDTVYYNILYRSEDDLNTTGKIFPMSLAFYTESRDIKILHLKTVQKECVTGNLAESDLSGFSIQEDGFRWINSSESSVLWYLDKKDYTMTVHQGPAVPFSALQSTDIIKVDVCINDVYADSFEITEETAGQEPVIKIDSKMLEKGTNKITFRTTLWNASELGGSDTRKLGFALAGLSFADMEE